MKSKVRILVPVIVLESLEADLNFFGVLKERICNDILLKFSLKYRSNYQHEMFFDEKEYLQFNLNKANQRYYLELIETNKDLNASEILREIFLTYALLHPALRELYLYREKISFIANSIKEFRHLRIDTEKGVIEGRIEKIFRCKKKGYLKILVNNEELYVAKIRVISYYFIT